MHPLLSSQSLSKSFGSRVLFNDLSFHLYEGDRMGLIGPNGSGKSSLLHILAGLEVPDTGKIIQKRGVKIGYVPQSSEFEDISPYQILAATIEKEPLTSLEKEVLIQTWLSKLGFSNTQNSAHILSGGWKKRLSFARALILSPDVLLLDEPTNHLDLEGILWLEKFLLREAPTYLLVSHDRYFLQHVTHRILEINRTYPSGMLSIDGSYSFFLTKKTEFLQGQIQQQQSLASKARKESEWLQQSPKARTTKARSRIEDANEILTDLSLIKERNRAKTADIAFLASERETRKLLVAKNLKKSAGSKTLFHHLDFTLSPGARIGLMGPNGSGKTTLLRLLAGEIEPDAGTIKRADHLKIVYFDQHRNQLPLHLSLREALSPNGEYVMFHGKPIHVNGWCKRFLFSPDILDMEIGRLSGGERARIAIAHLMLQPADLLLLDEPTNDLDIPTLETLEESLLEFTGAVVLITHDRCMMDRICTTLLALGDKEQPTFYADYHQWQNALNSAPPVKILKEEKKLDSSPSPRKKISYHEKREHEGIEREIQMREEELKQLNQQILEEGSNPNHEKLQDLCSRIAIIETQIEKLYLRWEELENRLSL